jgi:protein SCO1/2
VSDRAARRGDGRIPLVLGALVLISAVVLLTALRAPAPVPGSPSTSAAGSGGGAAASPPGAAASGPIDVGRFLLATPEPAAPLVLSDQDGRAFDLASLRGAPVFVFFGYTHCPDVCPATVGTVGQAMEAFGGPVRAVFVTVDPERDTAASLHEYVRYLATGFTALTGTADRVAAVAAAWGVQYARVDTGEPGEYSMAHTADVLLVDGDGTLRARFPFGTDAASMGATLAAVAGSPAAPSPVAPTPAGSAPATAAPAAGLDVVVGSSSVWAGPAGPIILSLSASGTRIDDPDLRPSVQLTSTDGSPVGPPVPALAVRPPGESRVLYVASPTIPTPGWWRLSVTAARTGITFRGSIDVAALDPGTTAALGAPAPTVRTPTLDDVGGVARAVTTDPAPDLRLSRTSTADALAAGQPFVLVIDSTRFKVTSACGQALVMVRYLVDRWPAAAFIHLEPLVYDVVTDTPVLRGSLADPTLNEAAAGWGLAGSPWGATSMPWVFVVDGRGIVRAKAQGVMGSDDVDVILALIAAGG